MSKEKGRKKPSNQTWWNESLEQGDEERMISLLLSSRFLCFSLQDFSPSSVASSSLPPLVQRPDSFLSPSLFREISNLFYLSLFCLPFPHFFLMHFSRGHLLFSFSLISSLFLTHSHWLLSLSFPLWFLLSLSIHRIVSMEEQFFPSSTHPSRRVKKCSIKREEKRSAPNIGSSRGHFIQIFFQSLPPPIQPWTKKSHSFSSPLPFSITLRHSLSS